MFGVVLVLPLVPVGYTGFAAALGLPSVPGGCRRFGGFFGDVLLEFTTRSGSGFPAVLGGFAGVLRGFAGVPGFLGVVWMVRSTFACGCSREQHQ